MNGIIHSIVDGLHVSGGKAVRELESDHEFDEVVTLNHHSRYDQRPPAASTTDEDFAMADGGEQDHEKFVAAADYVLERLQNDETVLVHCTAGVNRSPTVCAAALAKHRDLSAKEALDLVVEHRFQADPFAGTRESLKRYVNNDG